MENMAGMRSRFLALAVAAGVGMFVGQSVAADRPPPEYLKRAVVYQMVLRNFTRDGTFKAATEMLDHVRGAGIDLSLIHI